MNAYQEFKMIGSRPIRPDGLDKVTGRARYGADLNMQGQLYGHVVRSPHAHAVIKSIDCSKALAMEGVLAVMTGQDLVEPGNQMLGSGEGAMALKDVVPDGDVTGQSAVSFASGGCCGRDLARARRRSRASGGGGVRRAPGCHRRAQGAGGRRTDFA